MGWPLRMRLVCVSENSTPVRGSGESCEPQPFLRCVEVADSKSAWCLE